MRTTHVVLGAVAVLTMTVLAPVQSPFYLGSATSDSMEPAISPGDAYVVRTTDSVEVGDVVMFWSNYRGRYVTHRIVDRTPEGFVTKGDANPTTDQQAGAPPVPRSAVVGEVLTFAGRPFTLPGVGTLVGVIRHNGVLVVGLVVVLGTVLGVRDRIRGGPDRSVVQVRDVVPPLLVGAAVFGVASIALGANTHVLTYVAVAGDTPAAHTVPLGEETTTDVELRVSNPALNQLVVHARGVEIRERSVSGPSLDLTVAVPPAKTAGTKRAVLHVVSYPPTLPRGVLDRLYAVHPVLAAFASVATVLLPLYLLYALGLDPERPIRAPGLETIRGGGE